MVGTKRKRGGKKGGGGARRSRFVGVCWYKRDQKWQAKIKVRGVTQHLGYFHDEADGARAYDAAMAAQNLPYKRNFPDKRKSRFFGVSWNKQTKKWRVQIMDKGKK